MTMDVHNATSYSDISTYSRCPKSFDYRVRQNLQARRRSVPLKLGSLAHQQLQGWYLGQLREIREAQARELEGQVMEFDDALMSLAVLVEDATRIVDQYIDYYSEDEWTPMHVEEQFFVKLLSGGRVLSFTPDLVVSDRIGDVWVVDHKTTSFSRPRGFAPMQSMSHQPLLYLSGVQAVYPETRGFVFNYLRKKVPTVPRLTRAGEVADINRIDTTYELLNQFLLREAPQLLDRPVYQQKLDELKKHNRYFWRQTVYSTPQFLAMGMAEVMDWVTVMDAANKQGLYPRSFQNCDRCEFAPLCHSELLVFPGAQLIKDEQYQQREPKNVYEAEGEE